jgi:PPOX class probable F420-dependent enzyme
MPNNQLSKRARTFLQKRNFAVLATHNADGSIQQTTMWYLLKEDGETIVMNTKVGRLKERNMRNNPQVSLCIQCRYEYVTIAGTVTFIDDPVIGQRDIRKLAEHYDGKQSAAKQMRTRFSKEKRVSLHLKFERVYEYFSQ